MNTMIQKILLPLVLIVIMVSAFQKPVQAQLSYSEDIQTSFTVSGDEITIYAQSSVSFTANLTTFSVSVRVPDSYGIGLTVTNSQFDPVVLMQTDSDPIGLGASNFRYGYNGGSYTITFAAGVPVEMFTLKVSGGIGTGTVGLVMDTYNFIWCPNYVFLNGNYTDHTNYTDPFYGLTNADFTADGEPWYYRTASVNLGKVWTGAVSTAWNVGGNWVGGTVPGATDGVTIPDVANVPFLNTPEEVTNLLIESGAGLYIGSYGALTVSGTLTNNAGAGGLQVFTTFFGNGSLIASNDVTGTVTRYIPASPSFNPIDGWHLISSPVDNYAISDFTNLPLTSNAYAFYGWSELYTRWINYKNTTTWPTWGDLFTSNFELGTGYLTAFQYANPLKSFEGTINSGNVSVSGLTKTVTPFAHDGWHLMGNPFSSALTCWTGWTSSNMNTGGVNIWDPLADAYDVVAAGEEIPMCNGFMVEVSTAPGSFTMPASARVHGVAPFMKTVSAEKLILTAHNLDNGSFQKSYLRLDASSTNGFDSNLDCHFLAGNAPEFYSVNGSDQFALNTLPGVTSTTVIPFNFVKNEGANYKIVASGNSSFGENPWLLDKKTGTVVDLGLTSEYFFTSEESDATDRFELHFGIVTGNSDPILGGMSVGLSGTVLSVSTIGQVEGDVVLINMMGQEMMRVPANQGQTVISVDHVPAGAYFVRVNCDHQMISKKVVISQ